MRTLVGFESIQTRADDGTLVTGSLCVEEESGLVVFRVGEPPHAEQPSEAVKGSLGEFEEVEEPVQTE